MDFSKLAHDLIDEMLAFGITKQVIARRLGISRQAFYKKYNHGYFNTEQLTIMAAMSVTMCGGSVLVNFIEGATHSEEGKV